MKRKPSRHRAITDESKQFCREGANEESVLKRLKYMDWRMITILHGKLEQKWSDDADVVTFDKVIQLVQQSHERQLAVVTGRESKVVVFVFRGEDGIQTMKSWECDPHVKAPNGDLHWYVSAPGHLVSKLSGEWRQIFRSLFPGVLVKGDGCYVTCLGTDRFKRKHRWLRPAELDQWGHVPRTIRELFLYREFAVNETPAMGAKRDEILSQLTKYKSFFQGVYDRGLLDGVEEPDESKVIRQVREKARNIFAANPSVCVGWKGKGDMATMTYGIPVKVQVTDEALITGTPFFFKNGYLYHEYYDEHERCYHLPISTFKAVIVREKRVYNEQGTEPMTEFDLRVDLADGTIIPVKNVPLNEFRKLTWVRRLEHQGAYIICRPNANILLKQAITYFSEARETIEVYRTVGWLRHANDWVYLHNNGAICAQGVKKDIRVELPEHLRFISFSSMVPVDAKEYLTRSMQLLELGPMTVTAPLLALTYLAPLREFCTACSPNVMIWLHGRARTFKTSTCLKLQWHFGSEINEPQASFKDTPGATERLMHDAKDALLLVDDYHYATTAEERNRLSTNADILLRTAGNNQGRNRLGAGLAVKSGFHPGALVIATGETMPPQTSALQRAFLVKVNEDDIDLGALDSYSVDREKLVNAMRSYIAWLAGIADSLPCLCTKIQGEFEMKFISKDYNPRQARQAAFLMLGMNMLTQCAVDNEAITPEEQASILHDTFKALCELLTLRANSEVVEDPVARFTEILKEALMNYRAYLKPYGEFDVTELSEEDRLRWPFIKTEDDLASSVYRTGRCIGFIDRTWLYLFPDATQTIIRQHEQQTDQAFPVSWQVLLGMLNDRKVLKTQSEQNNGRTVNRNTHKVRIGAMTQWMLVVELRALFETSLPEPLYGSVIFDSTTDPKVRAGLNWVRGSK